MKKATIARFVIGLAAISAVGCSAETGAPEAEGVGSSEQAIGIAGLNTPTGYAEAKYSAYFPISADLVLVVGGFDHTGAAVSKVQTYNKNTNTWDDTPADLNTARGDAMIALIPNTDNLLILGGKSNETTNSRLDTAEIYDISAKTMTALAAGATHKLASPRIHGTVTQCGATANSQLLVIGGENNGPAAVRTLETFTYNAGTPANSVFALLSDNQAPSHTVELNTARQFHGTLPFSSAAKLVTVGGENTGKLGSSEIINITGSCVATDNHVSLGVNHPSTGTAFPSAETRTRFAFVPVGLSFGTPAVSYSGLVTAGIDGSSALTVTTLAYDSVNDAWAAGPSLAAGRGRMRPAVAFDSAGNFKALVGGDSGSIGTEASTDKADTFTNGGSGAWTTATLTHPRLGAWAAYINGTVIAGHGVDVAGPTYYNQPE